MVMKDIYSSKLNKKAQFFILSAVIMASIIVSLATVKNYVSTGDAPKKFYYYSQQLEDETGAVVDYALYSDPSGTNTAVKTNLNNFLQQSIDKTLAGYPSMEIFACYSNATDITFTKMICQNNGTKTIKVSTPSMLTPITLYGSKYVSTWVCPAGTPAAVCTNLKKAMITTTSLSVAGQDKILITFDDGSIYTVPIVSSSIQRSQFYFLLKMNTTSGDYVADSTGTKKSID